MITISYVDLLLTVLTGCAVGVTIALIVGTLRLRTTLARVDEFLYRAGALLPEIDRVSVEVEHTLQSVRRLSDRAEEIAGDVESMTSQTREAALPLLKELGTQVGIAVSALRHLAALVAGTKAGLAALGRSGAR